MRHILCEISTFGRYDTLPLTLVSIALQTRPPDELIIFDDNDNPEDLREREIFKYCFQLLDEKKIPWKVEFGQKSGQHHNHARAQKLSKDLIYRIDDDEIAEANVLETLETWMTKYVGAVGSLVLIPGMVSHGTSSGKIEDIDIEPNLQWIEKGEGEVEHLTSSFLYRKGIAEYDLRLSRVAHREDTMFSHEIFKKGYKLLVVPVITWHFRYGKGGIRAGEYADFDHDEGIFKKWLGIKDKPIYILDNGLGDHLVFRKLLDDLNIKDVTLATCFPEVFEGFNQISIADATNLGYDLSTYNLYQWMDNVGWKGDLYHAFKEFYHL